MAEDPTPYQTLADIGESELIVERSRFLGLAMPVETLEEALAAVAATRKEHYDARHVCFGLRIGRGAQGIDRSNDDGEPARTGGFPLWQLLDGEGAIDALIVVTRYFGGIKLGVGGLARAYRETGRRAMHEARIVTRFPELEFPLKVHYSAVASLEHAISKIEAVRVVSADYGAEVTFTLAVRRVQLAEVRRSLGTLLQRDPAAIGVDGDAS